MSRKPARSILTILGVTVGIAGFVALVGMSRGVERAWISSLMERNTHVLVMRKGAVEILSASLDEGMQKKLQGINGVDDVTGELADLTNLNGGQTAVVWGWEKDCYLWDTLHIVKGVVPDNSHIDSVIIGEGIVYSAGYAIGDKLQLYNEQYDIVGIFRSSGIMNNNGIILPLKKMQGVLDKRGKVTVFHMKIRNVNDRTAVDLTLEQLRKKFNDLVFTESRNIADKNIMLQLLRAIAWGSSLVALVTGLIIVLNTLLISIIERRKEVGILTAIGWSRKRILINYSIEGMILAFAGGVIGSIAGQIAVYLLARHSPLSGFINPDVDLVTIYQALLAALLLGLLGSIYPVWRSVRMDPAKALRYE